MWHHQHEASSLDQINMTKFWLDFDRKILTMTNLMLEHDQKFTSMNVNL